MPQTEIRSFDPLTLLIATDERLDFLAPDQDEWDLLTHLLGLPEEELSPIRGARDFCRPHLKQCLSKLYRPENLISTNRLVTALVDYNRGNQRFLWQRIPYLSRLVFEVQMLVLYAIFWRKHGLRIEVKPMEGYDQDRLDKMLTLTYLSTVTESDIESACEDVLSRLTGASV